MRQDLKLTTALRWTGAAALMASGLVFLLQGLGALSSFERFLTFAGLTSVLALLGLFTGIRMNEPKSARTFLGLAAAATPVLFAQLGGMLLAETHFAHALTLPEYMRVTAPSVVAIVLSGAATALVMAPVLYMGFGSFFRAHAKQLVAFMLAGSALLLVPSRSPEVMSVLVALQACWLIAFSYRIQKPHSEKESAIALALPMVPVAIMVGRQMFHMPTEVFGSAAFFWLASFCLTVQSFYPLGSREQQRMQDCAMGLGAVSWYFLITGSTLLGPMVSVFVPAALMMLSLSKTRKSSALYHAATIASFVAPVIAVFTGWDALSAFVLVSSGAAAVTLGYTRTELNLFRSGVLSAGLGMFYFITTSFQYFRQAPWISLAVLGVFVILAASWLEKNRSRLTAVLARFELDGK